ncbi:hypothetical protein FHS51_004162 [Sphingobium wenxiniae]|uniref:Uncharacterized protein n=1 Tax=Novosphingobium indicum TaxID=462949 RepID=A0ABQ2JV55_9SPHN|nr:MULTISPECIES: hypothetical protein [Sphingomonadaceae]MBB6193903.1 hypothetical protein [Sphingobium wenxiniae]GGN55647.1 hypothetical protein GCM10011349_32560 [Novosphingobium indicum]
MFATLLLAATSALTAQEAQTLPVAELAQRTLGATGAIVVDADRPKWPVCVGMCPPAEPHPDGPPPLTSLTFYTRASASSEAGWLGLCRASAVDVGFDKAGIVISVTQRTTVGWLGALTREKAGSGAAGAEVIIAQRKVFDERCRAMPTTRQFVSAFGPLDGERALIAVALVHDSMVKGGPIHVTCQVDFFVRQPCGTAADLRALADDVMVSKITSIEQIDPRTGQFVTGGAADSGCYRISLAQPFGSSDQINLCLRITNTLTVTRAAFSRNRVIY